MLWWWIDMQECESPAPIAYATRPTGTHPSGSSTLFLCPFSHDPTLQHNRLPSVTRTVTTERFPEQRFFACTSYL